MSDFKNRFPTVESFKEYLDENFDIYPVSWVTGGVAGGNCWGEGGHYNLQSEEEPEFTVLDEILLDVFPTLSFMQYRVLSKRDIVKVEPDNHSEYYGNYTEGKKKELDIYALYSALSDF